MGSSQSSSSSSPSRSSPSSSSSSRSSPSSSSPSRSSPSSSSSSRSSPSSSSPPSFLTSEKNSFCSNGYQCDEKAWYAFIKNKLIELETFENEKYISLLTELEIKNQEGLHELIYQLGDADLFFEKFLKPKIEESEKLLRRINADVRALSDFRDMPEDSKEMSLRNAREYRRENKKYNVYLLIEKTDFSEILQSLAPVMKYGIFHVGLEIDGVIIEWGCGPAGQSIVYPRVDERRMLAYIRLNYKRMNRDSVIMSACNKNISNIINNLGIGCIITFVLELLGLIYRFFYHLGNIKEDKLKIIAERCVYYNKTHNYHFLRNNCQHFLDQILIAIGLEFKPEGEFKKFMDRIKYKGDGAFRFKDAVFKSRMELDRYADAHWNSLDNEWDKKLLICFSDMMERMYERGIEVWGPMDLVNFEKWERRYEDLEALG
ncbi:11581_t:CDS:1 [Ambispora leptoticha]|uniref:11580_t:CDS:1 n=1 Tax=Ambispora leptoticha TaxID=144679 RepID=A0A9N9GMD5_9GLOM|nr:11580_t:CDS:1 [Ambispora leptoticha]CAG8612349.1 11581_t:CDS:1 [Ambispora leptoticha]